MLIHDPYTKGDMLANVAQSAVHATASTIMLRYSLF